MSPGKEGVREHARTAGAIGQETMLSELIVR